MQTHTDGRANALAWGFIVLAGGLTLGLTAMGVLYLWPGFDPLNLHPAGYWVRIPIASAILVPAVACAGLTAQVWDALRQRRRLQR